MNKYKEIESKLVFTHHGDERKLHPKRKDITKNQIINTIMKGTLGFAGSKRFKKNYKGIEVIYKKDGQGNIIVITFYKVKASYLDNLYSLMDNSLTI
ncbi:hypothetical protein JOC34_000533 [Virgibacillus halotolerans]|uniref:hypothetical protein n=1 Tax=Virgibacillus halotolerans TaxID=1071053 RepID=UPI001960A093|nr:hypothetical protein [Virgibacillus halotolerans]MBM7598176.1 hypothetical protein [Virgibacillus halotolerans]